MAASDRLRQGCDLLLIAAAGALLGACAQSPPTPIAPIGNVQAAWVVVGDGGSASARVATDSPCPAVTIDGADYPMQVRAPAATIPQRPTASTLAESKPSAFPVATCELALPAGASRVAIGGRPLPVPSRSPQRIVVIGDTGCRMKRADDAWQSCNDPNGWPFLRIAAAAARLKPDLVLHVGDYHYRENACPAGRPGCEGSPWGYGWDTWNADFFGPAAPLLAAAPWVFVRGNHEECARAGQGWFRFLDPHPYSAHRTCDDAADDHDTNYSTPYAVPFGTDTQLIVVDSAKAGRARLAPTSLAFAKYRDAYRDVGTLAAKPGVTSFLAQHHPILGFGGESAGKFVGGNAALRSVLQTLYPDAYLPAGVALALHGHEHQLEAISFATEHPATVVAGNGGDNVMPNLPDPFPAGASPAPGVRVARIAHTNAFGFSLLERQDAQWTFSAFDVDGQRLLTCPLEGRKLRCDREGLISPGS